MHSTSRWLAIRPFWVALLAAEVNGQGAEPQRIETNETAPAMMFRKLPPAAPRSPALTDLFAEPDAVMPALAASDVVGVGNTNPMMNGRVYEWSASTELDGLWTELPDGAWLWTYSIAAPSAAGLRIRFEPFQPPRGNELIVYNAANPAEAVGPYTAQQSRGDAPLWTSRIFGQEARIEWHVPASQVARGNFGGLQITGVLQLFPDPPAQRGGGCKLDVTCFPDWSTTAQSVAQYDFIDDGGSYVCTGAMITRVPVEDFCPLFLTAAHCIESATVAATMDIYWFFQTISCDAGPPWKGGLPRTEGATILRRDTDSDTCLLGLPVEGVPAGIVWAGWSSVEAPDPTPATLIHHPEGLRKSWSTGLLLGIEDVSQCLLTASTTYDFELTNGGQDGGSSGAPVFDNSNHRIRAVATCSVTDDCVPDEDTGEGSFAAGFPSMSPYLIAQNDVWVQLAWPGGENGSSSNPFDTLLEGWFAVRGGGTLHLRPGLIYPAFNFMGPRGMTLTADGGVVRIGG